MTDPSDALKSFQKAHLLGAIELQRGAIDPELFVHLDRPNGKIRCTYVRLQGRIVTAFVEFVLGDPIDGTPCFEIGCAVPEAYRNQGHAKNAVAAAISELQHGLSKNKIPMFYVEAIVGAHNTASQHVAAATISTTPIAVTDHFSKLPAFQYLRKIGKEAHS